MARITGKLGRIFLNNGAGLFIADLFEWTAEFELEMEPCAIKGEIEENYAVGGFSGRIRAQRYSTDGSNDSVFASGVVATANTAANDGTGVNGPSRRIQYRLEQIAGAAAGAIVGGQGIISRGGLNTPRGGMALDTIEIMMTSVPAVF